MDMTNMYNSYVSNYTYTYVYISTHFRPGAPAARACGGSVNIYSCSEMTIM